MYSLNSTIQCAIILQTIHVSSQIYDICLPLVPVIDIVQHFVFTGFINFPLFLPKSLILLLILVFHEIIGIKINNVKYTCISVIGNRK